METVRIRDPGSGMEKVGSGIRDKHPGSASLTLVIVSSLYEQNFKRSTGGPNFDTSLFFSIPKFDTIQIYMKYKENILFQCIIFIRPILDTTFLL
jgi:hypothetical protein